MQTFLVANKDLIEEVDGKIFLTLRNFLNDVGNMSTRYTVNRFLLKLKKQIDQVLCIDY